jgi:hypothetical protein
MVEVKDTTMFTLKSVLVGLSVVLALFVATFIYRAFGAVSATKTTGMGALLGDVTQIITSPVFWTCSALTFFVVIFLVGKYFVVGRP